MLVWRATCLKTSKRGSEEGRRKRAGQQYLAGGLSYYILSTTSTGVSQLEPLLRGSSLSIQAGIGQANLIAVLVNGTHLDLYINGSRLTQRSVSDNTSSSGSISVVVSSLMNSNTTAEVAFNDVKVWTL